VQFRTQCQKTVKSKFLTRQLNHESAHSPLSRTMEAKRIPRSRFKDVKADSRSEIILVTEKASPEDDQTTQKPGLHVNLRAVESFSSGKTLKMLKGCRVYPGDELSWDRS